MKKILITGGNGFLGSNLVKKLLNRNRKYKSKYLIYDKKSKFLNKNY